MPWVVRDAVRDINRMVGRRWQAVDPLLPDPAALPAGLAPLNHLHLHDREIHRRQRRDGKEEIGPDAGEGDTEGEKHRPDRPANERFDQVHVGAPSGPEPSSGAASSSWSSRTSS